MGIKFGEIDANQILENEYRIGVLEKMLERIINTNPNLVKPTQMELIQIRHEVTRKLQAKYPNSGIQLKGD